MALTNRDYTIGWIAALPIELSAATAMLDQPSHPALRKVPEDYNTYTLGSLGLHNVVMTCLPSIGNNAAASVATNMLRSFPNIRFGLMVGIGGGVPDVDDRDIRLGDIVVGIPEETHGGVLQFDFGTAIQTNGSPEFALKGYLNCPPLSLMSALRALQTRAEREGNNYHRHYEEMLRKFPNMVKTYSRPTVDNLYNPGYVHPGNKANCKDCSPSEVVPRTERNESIVHYGLIGSSNQVVRNAIERERWHSDKNIICFEMEAAGLMNEFPCLVIRGICDYCDSHKNKGWQRYASAQAASFAKELLVNISPIQIETTPVPTWILESMDQLKIVKDVKIDIDLGKLPSVDSAAFDSASNQLDPLCHERTRIEVRQQIREWMDNPNGKSMLWLSGIPGSGKSTLARTMAHEFAGESQLAASFFFKRGEGDRGNASRFITTIAKQMIHNIPSTKQATSEALTKDSSVTSKSFREQFEKLILDPLSTASKEKPLQPLVFVVDALDECSDDGHLGMIIQLFSQIRTLPSKRFKIFLTSRPEFPIQQAFRNISSEAYEELLLRDVPASVIENDIFLFMKDSLANVRSKNDYLPLDWPGEQNLQQLVSTAMPLFISAATICRFVGDHRFDPQEQLDTIIEYSYDSQTDQFTAAYQPVLNQMLLGLTELRKQKLLDEFRKIVGTVVLLENPLSIASLSVLLDTPKQVVERRLRTLHSVLNIPDDSDMTVRLHHLSFREYLTSGKRKDNPFTIDKREVHNGIAQRCLTLLNTTKCLKQDICSLDKPSALREEVDHAVIEFVLPPEVRYACLYLTRHLVLGDYSLFDDRNFHTFMNERLLFWVEALSWLGHVHSAASMLDSLLPLLPSDSDGNFLYNLLEDARKFVQSKHGMLHATPLQLYSSGLLFVPKTSLVREMYSRLIPEWTRALPQMQNCWQDESKIIQAHTGLVHSIAISHDGKQLASGSDDTTIKLWDATTGDLLETLSDHRGSVDDLIYTADDNRLISGSEDGTIKIWNTRNGALEKTLLEHGESIVWFKLTDNGQLLASPCQDDSVMIWDMQTLTPLINVLDAGYIFCFAPSGEQFATVGKNALHLTGIDGHKRFDLVDLSGRQGHWSIIGFSSSHPLIVVFEIDSALSKSHIYVYNTLTGVVHHKFTISNGGLSLIPSETWLLSPDGRYLAGITEPGDLEFLDILTGNIECAVRGRNGEEVLAFSPNGLYLVSVPSKDTINVWNTSTNQLERAFQTGHEHSYSKVRMLFASGDTRIWTWNGGHTISAWNLTTTSLQKFTIAKYTSNAFGAKLSPDGKLLACCLENAYAVRVWDCDTGVILYDMIYPAHRSPGFCFSPNSKHLISYPEGYSFDKNHKIKEKIFRMCNAVTGVPQWEHRAANDSRFQISPDSQHISWTSESKTQAGIFSLNTSDLEWDLEVEALLPMKESVFSPDSHSLAIQSYKGTISIWSVKSGRILNTLQGWDSSWISSYMYFSSDSEYILITDGMGHVDIFHWSSGCLQYTISKSPSLPPRIYSHFSPNSRDMFWGSSANLISLANVISGKIGDFPGAKSSEWQYKFSPNGRKIVSWSDSLLNPINVWDSDSLTLEQTFTSDSLQIEISFQADGRCLETSRGLIVLGHRGATLDPSRIDGEVFVSNHWVSVSRERLLWLPPIFRPRVVGYSNGKFAMIFASGRIMLFDEKIGPQHRTKWLTTASDGAQIVFLMQDVELSKILERAASSGRNQIVKTLIEDYGADVNMPLKQRGNILQIAAKGRNEELVQLLVTEYGADINAQSKRYGSALSAAIEAGSESIVQFLVEHNANVDICDGEGRMALHYAAVGSNIAIYDRLVTTELCDLAAKDKHGKSIVDYACISGSQELVGRALRHDLPSYFNTAATSTWSALHWASRTASCEVLELLIKSGKVPWIVETSEPVASWTLLDIAIFHNNILLVSPEGELLDRDRLDSIFQRAYTQSKSTAEDFKRYFTRSNSIKPGIRFRKVLCVGCLSDIYGILFHCLTCDDFDYCFMCKHDSGLMHIGHQWEHYDYEQYYNDELSIVEDA